MPPLHAVNRSEFHAAFSDPGNVDVCQYYTLILCYWSSSSAPGLGPTLRVADFPSLGQTAGMFAARKPTHCRRTTPAARSRPGYRFSERGASGRADAAAKVRCSAPPRPRPAPPPPTAHHQLTHGAQPQPVIVLVNPQIGESPGASCAHPRALPARRRALPAPSRAAVHYSRTN
jgi:hypothetical protein